MSVKGKRDLRKVFCRAKKEGRESVGGGNIAVHPALDIAPLPPAGEFKHPRAGLYDAIEDGPAASLALARRGSRWSVFSSASF